MVIRAEVPVAHSNAQTDVKAQRKLLAEYELKFAALPEHEKFTRLCSNAGLPVLDNMNVTCRENTLPRNYESLRVKGWIRGNTKIGPVLDVKICYHQRRYGVEITVESLLGDRTASWVRIVNGINKYVTERSEAILVRSIGDRGAGTPAARSKAKPKSAPTATSSHVKPEIKDEVKQESNGQMSVPYHERQWIDIEPKGFSSGCLEVSKYMIRLQRHVEEVPREQDGAVRYDDLRAKFKIRFPSTEQCSVSAWTSFLARV